MLLFIINALSSGVMILWKLKVVMAQRDISNNRLAELMGTTPVSISRMRNHKLFPRLPEETLDLLCTHLSCQPGDLMEWVPGRPSGKS